VAYSRPLERRAAGWWSHLIVLTLRTVGHVVNFPNRQNYIEIEQLEIWQINELSKWTINLS